MSGDALAARLRAIFAVELEEQVREADACLLALEARPGDEGALRTLFRVMHTLKGAARAAGVPEVEAVCHRLEALLAEVRDGRRTLDADALRDLFAGADALRAAAARLATAAPALVPSELAPSELVVPEPAAPAPESVRIGAARLDGLLSAATRLLITGGQLARGPEALRAQQEALARAAQQARALARQLRGDARVDARTGAQADALDAALDGVARAVAALADASGALTRDLTVVTEEIAAGVHALRLRPFREAVEALPRLVRDVAAATGKQVRLALAGEDVEADRAVLGFLRDAVLHLVRNAVDHGIEAPAVRRARGKPPEGTVRVAAELLGDRLVVTVADDGAGLDVAAVRARLAAAGEASPADDREVARRLFLGGISTRLAADAISGRGVGLDAVRAAVQRARGGVDVAWTPGAGTTFTLEVPLTLATVRALLVRVGAHLAALPTVHVERLLLLRPDDVAVAEGRPVVRTGGAPAPLASLARVLGPPLVERAGGDGHAARAAVLLHVGGRRLALAVDALEDEREVVVRPITGRGREPLPHVSGAALLASGEVALVLDATSVVATGLATIADAGVAPAAAAAQARRILVVDDSITTRTLEQSVLESAGYEVVTAVDGADGWRVLQERGADLVVADVEMPRMDGLELCRTLRASRRFRETPLILITALETAEDRARGLEAGADAYLGKSGFDQQALLDAIHDLIGSTRETR